MGKPRRKERAARGEFPKTGLLEDQEYAWLVAALAHFRRDCENRRMDEGVAERRIGARRHGQADSGVSGRT